MKHSIRHPEYADNLANWQMYRLVMQGGSAFIDKYLKTYSVRETPTDFAARKAITYSPAFAKSAIVQIKNSIYGRLVDVKRYTPDQVYEERVLGQNGGVNREGATMNYFIGQIVLPELIGIGKVGVFVDAPEKTPATLLDQAAFSPYLYIYRAEDILSWSYDESDSVGTFKSVLLRDYVQQVDEDGLVTSTITKYKHLRKTPEGVVVRVYRTAKRDEDLSNAGNLVLETTTTLSLKRIPFQVAELPHSLLVDAAGYQIALLNINSSDIAYCWRSNFPFYVEQYNPAFDNAQAPSEVPIEGTETPKPTPREAKRIELGGIHGRRYPMGAEAPGFIHPSAEPLKASMAKEDQMRREIKELVHLALTAIDAAGQVSADSKRMDQKGLEAGLSNIGMILENLEMRIAEDWSDYTKSAAAFIRYPVDYTLLDEDTRKKEAKSTLELMDAVPSLAYKRELAKEIVQTLFGHKLEKEVLEKMNNEINAATVITANPEIIARDVEAGVLALEDAAAGRAYPADTVEKAAKEHAERLARIAESQTEGVSGVPDSQSQPGADDREAKRQSRQATDEPGKKTRGDGRSLDKEGE